MQKLPEVVPCPRLVDKSSYVLSLPHRPYCTNRIGSNPIQMSAEKAIGYAHLTPNRKENYTWLTFDIDSPQSFTAHETGDCPPPTYIALNPANGHGHAAYLLDTPVLSYSTSSQKALRFLYDVKRGMTRRLGADMSYCGWLTKNPLAPCWETAWMATRPHRLDSLNDCLTKNDKRWMPRFEESSMGRNCTMFDSVRSYAYREVLKAKKAGISLQQFQSSLEGVASGVNATFSAQLTYPEVRSICRSVASWVWDEFTLTKFSALQKRRAQLRWMGHVPDASPKPWVLAGVSKATWYRNLAKGQ